MSTIDAVRGQVPQVPGARILIVQAPYYRDIVEGLRRGAAAIVAEAGATAETIDVAGAFELPQAIRLALAAPDAFDGYIALGCVVRGETSHYDHICDATMTGLMDVALAHGLALGTGLLTVETMAQAEARAQPDTVSGGANKGVEAAIACLVQVAHARRFGAAR